MCTHVKKIYLLDFSKKIKWIWIYWVWKKIFLRCLLSFTFEVSLLFTSILLSIDHDFLNVRSLQYGRVLLAIVPECYMTVMWQRSIDYSFLNAISLASNPNFLSPPWEVPILGGGGYSTGLKPKLSKSSMRSFSPGKGGGGLFWFWGFSSYFIIHGFQ